MQGNSVLIWSFISLIFYLLVIWYFIYLVSFSSVLRLKNFYKIIFRIIYLSILFLTYPRNRKRLILWMSVCPTYCWTQLEKLESVFEKNLYLVKGHLFLEWSQVQFLIFVASDVSGLICLGPTCSSFWKFQVPIMLCYNTTFQMNSFFSH